MPSSPRFAVSQELYSAEKADSKHLKIANSFSLLTVKQEQNKTTDNSMVRHGAICADFNLRISQQSRSEDHHSDDSPISSYNVSEERKSSYSSSFSTSSNDEVNH